MHCALRACIAQPAGVRRGCMGERKCSGRACRCAGARGGLRRGMGCAVGGRASRSLRACVGAAWGSGSAREGRVAVRGRAEVFGGEWVVRSAGLTHIRHSSTRARVLLYIRPPCPRREIAAMGPKDAPCEHPSPAKTFAPAPSAFALPRPRSHFPRPRSHFPRIAFRGPRRAIGLPQQQLSTMGYPRKSYPHCCSPPCAKRSRPRACARVYNNISFARRPLPGSVRAAPEKSPRRCGTVARTAVRRVGGGRRQRRTPPRAVPNHAACVPNHCVQRRKCTGPTLPVRSPRGNLSTAAPRPLMGELPCAKAKVHQANPAPARAFSPRQPAYGRAPAR